MGIIHNRRYDLATTSINRPSWGMKTNSWCQRVERFRTQRNLQYLRSLGLRVGKWYIWLAVVLSRKTVKIKTMADILNVYQPVPYYKSVSNYEIHSYLPYNTTRFDNNDATRITIQYQELYVLPSESSLHILWKNFKTSNESQKPTNTSLVNNAILHLF